MITKQEVLDFYWYLASNWLGIDNECALGRLVRGDRKIENPTIKTGSALTEYAVKLQKQEKYPLLFDYSYF